VTRGGTTAESHRPAAGAGDPEWHALDVASVEQRLESPAAGLSESEAERRRARYGTNRLPEASRRAAWKRLAAQFHNVLIYALIAAAVAALMLGHALDAVVIFSVVIVNALIGFIQEGRAEAAMAAIDRMLAQTTTVRRAGRWVERPAEELVPGDRVRVVDGDRVPADVRLIESHGLRVDQAVLTGESVPVSKHVAPVQNNAALADRRSIAYSGTLVVGGQAIGLVVGTGAATEIGRISTMLGEVEVVTTPLVRQINRFGHQLTIALIVISACVVTAGAGLHGMGLAEGFVAGVALLVAAIPEGLPAIITITLAIGVRRMAARSAIIRRLPAVETLGSVTVICSDKTGTLTQNRLRAARVLLAGQTHDLTDGERCPAGLEPLLRAAVLCNDAESGGGRGDPLESALLELAVACGTDPDGAREQAPRRGLVPFSSSSKWMATVHDEGVFVKGAPEVLIEQCEAMLTADGRAALDRADWHRRLERLAGQGFRLLALARASAGAETGDDRLPAGLVLLGVVAFEDPLRDGVIDAIAACHAAGIRVKMITGDHPDTARAVARSLGLAGEGDALTGPKLDTLSPDELADPAQTAAVFARTTSEHKLRLVEALQARGEVVAMTGDGANDAPALKRADIGVAMGIKGTEAAHEASEMVLTDDDFATIVAGIEEGRGVYDNIRKALVFILPTNAGEAMVILLAVLTGLTLPLTPVQVLWVNMATAVTLALALAFEPVETDVMRAPPRDPRSGLVTRWMLVRIAWVGLFLTTAVFLLFDRALSAGASEALARGVALNMLVAGEIVYLFNCRRWTSPSWTAEALGANPAAWISVIALLALQTALTYWPPMQTLFGVAPPRAGDWLTIAAVCALLFVLVELEKLLVGRRVSRRRPARAD
jgi:calcium-translocating P-type ATPase